MMILSEIRVKRLQGKLSGSNKIFIGIKNPVFIGFKIQTHQKSNIPQGQNLKTFIDFALMW
jgi:hypothetical protein